ncbi:MAG: CstA-like transporter-associated (seleno)protein [Gammaproteobacteria bacterium]
MGGSAKPLRMLWGALREASGDDAYERYLAHWRARPSHEKPLSQAEFYRTELERKWSGLRRCC